MCCNIDRGIMLMSEMFKHLGDETSFPDIVSNAYEMTVKQYHNVVARSVFAVSISVSIKF